MTAQEAASPSIAEVLRKCLDSGRQDEWEAFIHATRGLIAGSVSRTLRQWTSPSLATIEDLTQEVYLTLCKDRFLALRRFRAERPEALLAYLRTIASSVALDHLRSISAKKRGEGKALQSMSEVENQAPHPAPPAAGYHQNLFLLDVERCLGAQADLEERDRTIFWLYYRYGFTAKAIAGVNSLKLTLKGVESVILRTTRQVRDCIRAVKPSESSPDGEGKPAGDPS